MSGSQSDEGFNKERADLFEALGHPLRLEILRALSESPLGFADLKRKVNVTSSGHLTHHLEKLDGLVMTTPDGLYALTDEGKEALRIVSVSKESTTDKVQGGKKLVISRAVLAGLVAALLLLASVAVIQELELTSLMNKTPSQQSSQGQMPPYILEFGSPTEAGYANPSELDSFAKQMSGPSNPLMPYFSSGLLGSCGEGADGYYWVFINPTRSGEFFSNSSEIAEIENVINSAAKAWGYPDPIPLKMAVGGGLSSFDSY